MFTSLFNFLLKILFWLLGVIGSIIVYPVQLLLTSIIPGFDTFIEVLIDFMDDTVFPMISFVKEIALDITCLPRPLWAIFIGFLFALWGIAPAVRTYRLIVNMWRLKSGSSTASGSSLVGKEFDI